MNKIAHYLQEHVLGEVIAGNDARRYFSTDGSIFTLTPSVILYPRNENDVRKTARFTWQLAERGRVVPMTARGSGTDQSGAALGEGIIIAFPAHMNRIVELDTKSGVTVVEPGLNFGRLEQTLHTHDRFLPPYPSSFEYCTVGGAIANNAAGEKTIKYGAMREFVRGLRIVLANGEVIQTGRLSKRELSKKLGLSTFEGEIYRALDALLEENVVAVRASRLQNVTKNSAGYALSEVKHQDGSFDLTPLLVGSQGTLGIVTEATLDTAIYNPETSLYMASFNSLEQAGQAVVALRQLKELPSAIELVDKELLKLVEQVSPNQLAGLIEKPYPAAVLIVEFDDGNERQRKHLSKQAEKIFDQYAVSYKHETAPAEQAKLWKVRHASAAVVAHSDGQAKALPIIEDGVVPPEKLSEYISSVYRLFDAAGLQAAVWGHAGDGNLHMQPFLDLAQVGDRQKAFKLIDAYYKLVVSLGGSTSGEHNDGRLRAPYLEQLYGEETYKLFQKVKQIFDPYGTLNPGVKVNVTLEDIKPLVRNEYSMDHLYDHLPRS